MKGFKINRILFMILLSVFCVSAAVCTHCAETSAEESTETTTGILTESTTETVTESVSETVTESTTETVTDSTAETVTETVTESGTEISSKEADAVSEENTTDDTDSPEETPPTEDEETTERTTEKPTHTTEPPTETQTVTQTSETPTESTTIVTVRPHPSSGGGGGSGGTGGGVFNSKFSELADKQNTENESETEATTQVADSGKTKFPDRFGTKQKKLSYFIDSHFAYLDKMLVNIVYSPYIQKHSSSALISVRSLQAGLGRDVGITWQAKTKTAVVKYGGHTVKITADKGYLIADGKSVDFKNGAYAEIKDGRIYLPFRALGEALGFNVGWDGEKRAAVYFISE